MHFSQGHKANRQCGLDFNSGNVGPKPRLLIPKPRCLSVFLWSHKGNGQTQVHIWVKHQNWMMGVCARSCPTLCSSMDCSPPGSSVHGISQAKLLERVAISFSRGSSQPGVETVSPDLLHWQVDSLPLCHLGSPIEWWIYQLEKEKRIFSKGNIVSKVRKKWER